jgi:hypothetical protein
MSILVTVPYRPLYLLLHQYESRRLLMYVRHIVFDNLCYAML